ncbi:MAG: hypothetical protein FJ217_14510 [Ignavibacteria bacterium]|nr:hypothetical protein [Ignavibacteria bacterium]
MAALPAIVALLALGFQAPLLGAPDTLLVEDRAFGSFQRATRLAVSPQGWLYALDADRNLILLLKEDGSVASSVGGYGWTATTLDEPSGLATDGLSVYVSDFGNHRVLRFDRRLNYISSFTTRDTDYVAARFGYPAGVALSRLGDLFILDTENVRVVKYTGNGRFERSFGGIDEVRGRLARPLKILAASNDHIYVLEADRVLEYDYFGNHIRTIGNAVLKGARGFDVIGDRAVVATQDALYWFSERGEVAFETPFRSLLTSSPIDDVEDVAIVRDTLFVLTIGKIVAFKIRAFE